jgi:glyoxylase-like metal-dependent hydrolase (beta-lactamase superfamily II)
MMLSIGQHGPITVFRMGRHVAANHRWVLYETHAFLIDETMIDTGTIAIRREWESKLDGCRCSAIVNTHHHEDHIGNNRLFQDRFGAEIYAHPGALAFLEEPRKIGLQLYRRVVWNTPDPSRGRPIGETVATSRHILHVFQTPGHCPDHLCLYEPVNGWLFSGDIFCGKRVVYLRADEDFNGTLESLKRLAALDIRTIYCGLKGVVEEGGRALKEKIRGMEELRGRALELHEKGLSPREIRRRLLGYEDRMYYITSGHFSKQNVIDSILGKG